MDKAKLTAEHLTEREILQVNNEWPTASHYLIEHLAQCPNHCFSKITDSNAKLRVERWKNNDKSMPPKSLLINRISIQISEAEWRQAQQRGAPQNKPETS